MTKPIEQYRVFAVKYAFHDRPACRNFMDGNADDHSMPLDYFVWVIVGSGRTFIVDTGFDADEALKRGRTIMHSVEEGLKKIGVRPDSVEDVIITHMHYDHAGNRALFPHARYHLQQREIAFCTGPCMCHRAMNLFFEPEDVKSMVGRVFEGRVRFYDGTAEIASGLSVHWVGGHTDGLQIVRVHTERGWIVLASDAAHFYANLEQARPFPGVSNMKDMLEGYAMAYRLADSPAHVVPGHDPQVLSRYRAYDCDTEGWIARLDTAPI